MQYIGTCTNKGLLRELNPGPLAPEARIMPLDQAAMCGQHKLHMAGVVPHKMHMADLVPSAHSNMLHEGHVVFWHIASKGHV